MSAQALVALLADRIPKRDAAVQACEDIRSTYEAEFATAFTQEKRLKEEVESLKRQLREQIADSGEKVEGVTLARIQGVVWNAEHLDEIVAWASQYAPALLTLKGPNDIRKWFFGNPIQMLNINGQPSAVLLVSKMGEDGHEVQFAVNCPFRMQEEVQVRISEAGILTAVDKQQWEAGHGE